MAKTWHGAITDVPGIRVGHVTDTEAMTGCTVVLCPTGGAVGGVDQRGGAPGTRETDLLRPLHLVQRVHAVLLAGGSAFGLDAAGLRVLARRFRLRSGEIDLVAERGDLVVFVEVKARRSTRYGRPAAAVTGVKQRRMARAALAFLSRTGRLERRVRFDVVEVWADEGGVRRVRHIEDAFRLDRDP